jgi:ATPase complex subunit ATP10
VIVTDKMITTRTTSQGLRRGVGLDSKACLLCQWRSFSTSYRRLAEKEASKSSPQPSKATSPASDGKNAPAVPEVPPSPLADAPRAYGKAVSEFTPKPLSRPIGLPKPPRSGENAGLDGRSWKQRRDDFVNYDKHIVRRKEL